MTCGGQIVTPAEKPAMALAVRMMAWLVAEARVIQLAAKETLQSMRVRRRPHLSNSRPPMKHPKGLATAWILAAIKDQ